MQFESTDFVLSICKQFLRSKHEETNNVQQNTHQLQGALTARLHKLHVQKANLTSTVWLMGAIQPLPDVFELMDTCRSHLMKIDENGWTRSYHQRLFHEDFLKACTRSFFKMHKPGSFARQHAQILRVNSWNHLAQEILISTPRRSLFEHVFCKN